MVTLTWSSVAVVVHHCLRRMRCSAAHTREGHRACNEEFNERTRVDQNSHARPWPPGHHVRRPARCVEWVEWNGMLYTDTDSGWWYWCPMLSSQRYLSISSLPSPLNFSSSCFHGFQSAPYFRKSRDSSSRCPALANYQYTTERRRQKLLTRFHGSSPP